jgi:hypothetical protein
VMRIEIDQQSVNVLVLYLMRPCVLMVGSCSLRVPNA